jgi:hypothetical protein
LLKARNTQGVAIDALDKLLVTGRALSDIEISDFIVAEALNVILVEPHLICTDKEVLAKLLSEIARWTESPDVPPLCERACRMWRSKGVRDIIVDAVVGKRCVHVLVNDI